MTEEAEERSRSSDRVPSRLLLSDRDWSEAVLDLFDIPPMGRLVFAMLFSS